MLNTKHANLGDVIKPNRIKEIDAIPILKVLYQTKYSLPALEIFSGINSVLQI